MKSSCISYPENEPLVLIRASQVRICEGNHCAAALLSYFGYWHDVRLNQMKQAEHANKMAALHGDTGTQETTLLQYHTEDDIEAGLLHLYGRKTIRTAVALLVRKQFLSLHENPNTRYRFDRTHYFLFHPDKAQTEIGAVVHEVKIPDREKTPETPPNGVDSTEISPQAIDNSHEVKMPDREGYSADSSGKNAAWSGKNTSPIAEITSEITDRDLKAREGERARADETKEGTSVDTSNLQKFEQRFSAAPSYSCPGGFVPDPAIRTWAAATYPDVDFEAALAAMRVWESPRPVRNWNLKLKSFVQKEPEFRSRGAGSAQSRNGQDFIAARREREQEARRSFVEKRHGRSAGLEPLLGRDDEVIDGVEYRIDD